MMHCSFTLFYLVILVPLVSMLLLVFDYVFNVRTYTIKINNLYWPGCTQAYDSPHNNYA